MTHKKIRLLWNYPGSKWTLTPKFEQHFPTHRHWVSVFGGTGAEIVRRSAGPSELETYNDLNGDIVGVFRILQDKGKFDRLCHMIENTPNSRADFDRACAVIYGERNGDDVLRAWAFLVVGNYGWTKDPTLHTFWRAPGHKEKWRLLGLPEMLVTWRERFKRVKLEQRDFAFVLRKHDKADTFFFCDPPYHEVHDLYLCDLTEHDQRRLLERLLALRHARAWVCGYYPCDLYDEYLVGFGWRRLLFPAVSRVGALEGKRQVIEAARVNYDEDGRLLETDRLTDARHLMSVLG